MWICKGILNLNLCFVSTLDKEPAVPVDSEPVSKGKKTMERVTNDLGNCSFRNEQIDTCTADHLLSKQIQIM